MFTGVTGPIWPCVAFYGDGRSVKMVSISHAFTSFDHLSSEVALDPTDATGKTVVSTGSSKSHAVMSTALTGKCAFEFTITKDVINNEMVSGETDGI